MPEIFSRNQLADYISTIGEGNCLRLTYDTSFYEGRLWIFTEVDEARQVASGEHELYLYGEKLKILAKKTEEQGWASFYWSRPPFFSAVSSGGSTDSHGNYHSGGGGWNGYGH